MNKALEEEPHFKFSVIFEKKKENKKKKQHLQLETVYNINLLFR